MKREFNIRDNSKVLKNKEIPFIIKMTSKGTSAKAVVSQWSKRENEIPFVIKMTSTGTNAEAVDPKISFCRQNDDVQIPMQKHSCYHQMTRNVMNDMEVIQSHERDWTSKNQLARSATHQIDFDFFEIQIWEE